MRHIGDPRTALLAALAVTLDTHQHDAETCGREALRLMRQAEATWADLLGPALPPSTAADGFDLTRAGYQTIADARMGGRVVLSIVHVATPAELARAAVLANQQPPTLEGRCDLTDLMHTLARRHQELEGHSAPASAGPASRSA